MGLLFLALPETSASASGQRLLAQEAGGGSPSATLRWQRLVLVLQEAAPAWVCPSQTHKTFSALLPHVSLHWITDLARSGPLTRFHSRDSCVFSFDLLPGSLSSHRTVPPELSLCTVPLGSTLETSACVLKTCKSDLGLP